MGGEGFVIAGITYSAGYDVLFFVKDTKEKKYEVYASYEKAQAKVKELESQPYALDNNCHPDFLIVDEASANWVNSGRNNNTSNYNWAGAKCGCRKCSDCLYYMMHQDIEYLQEKAQALNP